MPIKVGDSLPKGQFHTMTESGVINLSTDDIFAGKRVVLFGVPAVFTPGCTQIHLPSYVDNAAEIKARGFDTIACLAVSDAWVMHAWGQTAAALDQILMLADGNASYVRLLGIDLDLTAHGMGIRCRRFSMVVDDGVLESLNFDATVINATAAPQTCNL